MSQCELHGKNWEVSFVCLLTSTVFFDFSHHPLDALTESSQVLCGSRGCKEKKPRNKINFVMLLFFRTFLVDVVKRQQQTCKNSHFGTSIKNQHFWRDFWFFWTRRFYIETKLGLLTKNSVWQLLKRKYNFWTKSWVMPQCAKCMDLCWSSLVVLVLNPLIVYRMPR